MKTLSSHLGTLLVLAAGICWGFISIFIRSLSAAGLSSLQIVGLRSWFSVLFLLVYALVRQPSLLRIRLRDLWMFLGSGVLSTTFFTYCYFSSIVRSGAAVSVVLLYTSPIFVMLMSAVVFRERITRRKLVALLLTFGGCVLVAGLVGSAAPLSPGALLLGLGTGFGYALYSIFAGLAVRRYSSLTITFYTMLFSGCSLFFLIDLPVSARLALSVFPRVGWAMVDIAFFCTVLPYLFYTAGLSRMDAGRAAVLVTVEPLVGALLGIFLFHEPVDALKILGIGLIFEAVLLLAREGG